MRINSIVLFLILFSSFSHRQHVNDMDEIHNVDNQLNKNDRLEQVIQDDFHRFDWNNASQIGLGQSLHEIAGCNIEIDYSVKPSCSGNATGQIIINRISGGNRPYKFEWSNGSNDRSLDKLKSGNYSVTIKDATGCTLTRVFFIKNNPEVLVRLEVMGKAVKVKNLDNRKLKYLFFDSQNNLIDQNLNSDTKENLISGKYYCLAIDDFGCSKRIDFLIE